MVLNHPKTLLRIKTVSYQHWKNNNDEDDDTDDDDDDEDSNNSNYYYSRMCIFKTPNHFLPIGRHHGYGTHPSSH